MRLSEAMMLGSVTCKMVARDWNSCGLGAAANALSLPLSEGNSFDDPRYKAIVKVWPWLAYTEPVYVFVDGEQRVVRQGSKTYWAGEIACKFDGEVCSGAMTFEQLVDWVRSVEPECEECNSFECACVKVTPLSEDELVKAS